MSALTDWVASLDDSLTKGDVRRPGSGGGIDALYTLLSSAAATPIAGAAGAIGAIGPGPQGQGAAWSAAVADALTRAPKTEEGRAILGRINELVDPVYHGKYGTEKFGEKLSEVFGPEVGATMRAIAEVAPQTIFKGARGVAGGAVRAGEAAVSGAEAAAARAAEAGPAAAFGQAGALNPKGAINLPDPPPGYIQAGPGKIIIPKTPSGRQTVRGATSNETPLIYEHPRIAAERAAAKVVDEDPLLQELFGIDRPGVDEETLRAQDLGAAATLHEPTRPPEHIERIFGKANTTRLQNALEVASEHPSLEGSYGWYWSDPLFQRFAKLLGPLEGFKAYDQFQQLGSGWSPRSAVLPEIEGSSAAYTALRNRNIDPILDDRSVLPIYKMALQRTFNTGDFLNPDLSAASKTRTYYPSRTGQNYYFPTGDAHFVRGVGLADVRPFKSGGKDEAGNLLPREPNLESVSGTEAAPVGHWFAKDVAGPLGFAGSPSQALIWNLFGPATGVDSPLSAPLLELIAKQVGKTAKRKGMSPNDALDEWILGKGDKLGLADQVDELGQLRELLAA